MMRKPRILAFAGSTRKDSYNKKLVRIAAHAAQECGAEVTVIDLSPDEGQKNPLQYAAAVRNCAVFERLALSGEDERRTEMYRAQKERAHA